jgi:hypothetical protein
MHKCIGEISNATEVTQRLNVENTGKPKKMVLDHECPTCGTCKMKGRCFNDTV